MVRLMAMTAPVGGLTSSVNAVLVLSNVVAADTSTVNFGEFAVFQQFVAVVNTADVVDGEGADCLTC